MYNFIAKLLNFIESSTDNTKTEIVIAEYILQNVNKIPEMSIYELADACHTSPATITRFCRKFENITYKELKEYARTYIEFNYSEVAYEHVESKLDIDQIDSYFNELENSIQQTRELIQSEDFIKTINYIHQAKKVSFFGVTFSHLLARNAQFKFMRLGKFSSAYSSHEHQITEAESLTKDNVAIIISFSGQTRFIVRLVKVLKSQGIPILAITGNEQSYLAEHAAHIHLVSNRKLMNYKSPILEEINMLSVVNSIYIVYSSFINTFK